MSHDMFCAAPLRALPREKRAMESSIVMRRPKSWKVV